MHGRQRAVWAVGIALALGAAAPSAASAAGATVTGDAADAPVALGGPVAIRNMDPEVVPNFTADEVAQKRDYSLVVLDPAGNVASNRVDCLQASGNTITAFTEYRGNGAYTAVLTTYPDTERSADGCKTGGTEQRLVFTIGASTAVGPLPPQLLRRDANSFSTKAYEIPVALNPGAVGTELRYAAGGVIGPDGAISGASESAPVLSSTGKATVFFPAPGRYVFVARARNDNAFTPWSAPVTVDVLAPFDFASARFSDARGPSYAFRVTLRETVASGKVSVALARGKRGGRYRSVGSATIRNGVFTKRFKQRRTGTYRMRFTYKGSALVTPGRVVEQVRFTRRFVSR